MPQSAVEPLVIRRHLHAPFAEVYKAWTDATILRRWLAPDPFWVEDATVELYAGGKFRIGMIGSDLTHLLVVGTMLEVTPNRLVVLWEWEGEFHKTRVTVELHAASPKITEIVLTHKRFVDEASRQRQAQGWNSCFDKLARTLGSPV